MGTGEDMTNQRPYLPLVAFTVLVQFAICSQLKGDIRRAFDGDKAAQAKLMLCCLCLSLFGGLLGWYFEHGFSPSVYCTACGIILQIYHIVFEKEMNGLYLLLCATCKNVADALITLNSPEQQQPQNAQIVEEPH